MKNATPRLRLACILVLMLTFAAFGQQASKGLFNPETNVQAAIAYEFRAYGELRTGDLNGAIADYDRAIQLNPKFAVAYCNRGVAKVQKGDLNGVIADCDKAIQLDPKLAEGYAVRGAAKVPKGDLDGAIADCDKAIQLNPKLAEAYWAYCNRGVVKERKGDLNGALADYNQAIELNPKYAVVYRNRGNAKFRSGDFDGAIADFDRVIELSSQRVYKEGAAPASLPQVGSSSHLVPVRTSEVKSGDVIWWRKQHRVNPYLTNADDFELYGKVLDVAKFYTPPQVIIFRPDTTVARVTVEEFFSSGKYFLQVPTPPSEVAARKAHGKAQLEIDAQRQHEIDAKFLREAQAEKQRWNEALKKPAATPTPTAQQP